MTLGDIPAGFLSGIRLHLHPTGGWSPWPDDPPGCGCPEWLAEAVEPEEDEPETPDTADEHEYDHELGDDPGDDW